MPRALRFLTSLAAIATSLLACATTGGFRSKMNTWLNQDVNRLMTAWGPPGQSFEMPNGSRMYTWLWVGNTVVTANYNAVWNMVTAGSVTYWCQVTMVAAQSSRIVSWSARGNACRG